MTGDLSRHSSRPATISDQPSSTDARLARNAVTGPCVAEYGPTGASHNKSTSVPNIMHSANNPNVGRRPFTAPEYAILNGLDYIEKAKAGYESGSSYDLPSISIGKGYVTLGHDFISTTTRNSSPFPSWPECATISRCDVVPWFIEGRTLSWSSSPSGISLSSACLTSLSERADS